MFGKSAGKNLGATQSVFGNKEVEQVISKNLYDIIRAFQIDAGAAPGINLTSMQKVLKKQNIDPTQSEALFEEMKIGDLVFYRESFMDRFGPNMGRLEMNRGGSMRTAEETA